MKKIIAAILVAASGLYLLIIGPLPFGAMDPLPFIDEAAALLVLLNSLAYLGLDIRKLFGIKGKDIKEDVVKAKKDDQTIDV